MSVRRWFGIATLVSRNLVPLAGILFLGWNALNILVLHFADFMFDLGRSDGGEIFPPLMVAAYCGATIHAELFPDRWERLFNR